MCEAEALALRSVAIHDNTKGSDASELATSLNNLATVFKLQGKYKKAESRYRRALSIYEKALAQMIRTWHLL